MKAKHRQQIEGIAYVLPAMLLYSCFVLIPIICVFVYSTMEWDGMGEMTFVGLANFVEIFKSAEFRTALGNNIKFFILGVPLWTIFPMIVAVLLHEEVKGWRFFRSAYFFRRSFPRRSLPRCSKRSSCMTARSTASARSSAWSRSSGLRTATSRSA